jgi:hypothetical protein
VIEREVSVVNKLNKSRPICTMKYYRAIQRNGGLAVWLQWEFLLCKPKALSLNPSPAKKRKKERKKS